MAYLGLNLRQIDSVKVVVLLQFVIATTISYQIFASMDRTYPAEIGKNATIWCKTSYPIFSRNTNIFIYLNLSLKEVFG